MNWSTEHLPEYLDARGDLAPPWSRFPEYERYSLGWRMGMGETWLGLYSAFLQGLPVDRDTRLAYLGRHPPAPYSWWDVVEQTLSPSPPGADDAEDVGDAEDEDHAVTAQRIEALRVLGLVASDVAYPTWRARQGEAMVPPWTRNQTPEKAVRYATRDLWFWSRQWTERRGTAGRLDVGALPPAWEPLRATLETGAHPPWEPARGLWTLATMLCAGEVLGPWSLGLGPADFRDSFAMDMGYTDAFRLWVMSAFDDRPHWETFLQAQPPPAAWLPWIAAECAQPG